MSTHADDLLLLTVQQLIVALLTRTAASARHLGLSIAEVAALEHLNSVGELTPKQLGLRLAMSSGTVTALLDRLEQADFIVRVRHPLDRRSYLVRPDGARAAHVARERLPLLERIHMLNMNYSDQERQIIGGYLALLAELVDTDDDQKD